MGIHRAPRGFPSQRAVTRSFGVLLDLCLNKRLSKQSRRRWFETPSRSLWRHCNESWFLLSMLFSKWGLTQDAQWCIDCASGNRVNPWHRLWVVACSVLNHYQNQRWIAGIWNPANMQNTHQWNLDQHAMIFNTIENVVCKKRIGDGLKASEWNNNNALTWYGYAGSVLARCLLHRADTDLVQAHGTFTEPTKSNALTSTILMLIHSRHVSVSVACFKYGLFFCLLLQKPFLPFYSIQNIITVNP